jgi:hypothetical protein
MIVVRFNDPDEFLDELRRDHERLAVDRGVVRVSRMFRPHPHVPGSVWRVYLVASYVKARVTRARPKVEPYVESAEQLVRFETYVGEAGWKGPDDNEQAFGASDKLLEKIEPYVESLSLELAHGAFETDEVPR